MEITEWRPMAHWNEVFGLELSDDEVDVLDTFLALVAKDERFERVEGYALARLAGRLKNLYSADLVRTMLRCISSIPDKLPKFLRAASHVDEIPVFNGEGDGFDNEAAVLLRLELHSRQAQYAERLNLSLFHDFGYRGFLTTELETFTDPGLMKTACAIAKRRYPKRSKS